MSKSLYSFVISEGVLCIYDQCGPTNMTVTNNAENVLDEIKENLKANNTPMPDIIIYNDTNGDWDGMEYDGRDVHFYFLDSADLTEAINVAKNHK